jgi:predicted transcriptional regulator of viral defense system
MPKRMLTETALAAFRRHGGILSASDALRLGIHARTLYALRDSGALEQLSRGLYRLADLPPLSNPDLVIVARRVPRAVVCLISALAFHELTTQIPHAVDIALPPHTAKPVLEFPPLRVFWFSGLAWSEGVEVRRLDGVPVRVYDAAKSVVDCFKYRNKLGLDIALEALHFYRQRRGFTVDTVLHYARVCRVEHVMRPYLEAIL